MKKTLSIILAITIFFSLTAIPVHAFNMFEDKYIVGDVNSDESVEIDDVTYLQRHLLEITLPFEFNEISADADEDGYVTAVDATCLQRWLIGISKHINIGENVHPWHFDRNDADKVDGTISENLTITRICQNHFFATPIIPLPIDYKIYGRLSDDWHVGDDVRCTLENVYYSEHCTEADLVSIERSTFVLDPDVAYKPVIYLYPEEETEIDVKLELNGEFLYTYPEYKNGWNIKAAPDGTLTARDGAVYPYLFWEAKLNAEYDFSSGFCVKGEDTERFLRDSLTKMGLSQHETDDFIEFWLKYMRSNPYNVISFRNSAYTDAAKLDITPCPDTIIRVFMAWYPSDEAVEIPDQEIISVQKKGFTAVEWGGQMCG